MNKTTLISFRVLYEISEKCSLKNFERYPKVIWYFAILDILLNKQLKKLQKLQ